MLKQLCIAIELIGDLRKGLNGIDFSKVYADPEKAANAKMKLLEKELCLSDLQHDLLELVKEA